MGAQDKFCTESLRQLVRNRIPKRIYHFLSKGIDAFATLRGLGLWEFLKFYFHAFTASNFYIRVPAIPNRVLLRGYPSPDVSTFQQCFLRSIYDCCSTVNPPEFIIDAGANIGASMLWFLSRYPQAQVIGIEPHIENFEICAKNIREFAPRGVVVCKGLWSQSDKILNLVSENVRSDSFSYSSEKLGKGGGISSITIPQLLCQFNKTYLDIFKCDIEGAEIEIFDTSHADLWIPKTRTIAIEIHGTAAYQRVFHAAKRHNLEHFQFRECHVFINPKL